MLESQCSAVCTHVFAWQVHQLKQKQLKKMLQKAELPLRDGIAQVSDH